MEKLILSRELLDLVSIVKNIVRHEFSAGGGPKYPTLTQYRILRKIQMGTCHVGKLAESFGISQPATSIMVNTLVKQGLLKRVPHPTDRRQIELQLTSKAIHLLNTGHKRTFAKLEKKFASLSGAKKKALATQLRELSLLLTDPLS